MGCIANALYPFLPEYSFEGEGAEIEKKKRSFHPFIIISIMLEKQ